MTIYQYLPFIMIALVAGYIIISIFFRKKKLKVELFVEGLKYENSGYFEEAILNYDNALTEIKKDRFHGKLKNKIIQKLKVLHTIIEYKKSLLFTRSITIIDRASEKIA